MIENADFGEGLVVFDCSSQQFLFAQETIFDRAGTVLSNYKMGDPAHVAFDPGTTWKDGSLLGGLHRIACDDQFIKPMVTPSDLSAMPYSFLADTSDGKGEIFYVADAPADSAEHLLIIRMHDNTPLATAYTLDTKPVGIYGNFKFEVDWISMDCASRTYKRDKIEHYDSRIRTRQLDPSSRSTVSD